MANRAVAPIMVDGTVVGFITSGNADDVSPDPLGNGNALGAPAPSPAAFPRMASREYPSRGNGGIHYDRHPSESRTSHGPLYTAPRRTLGGQHTGEHHRHLDPANREHTSDSDRPQHFSVGDVQSAVNRTPGAINRSHHAKVLAEHPELREKILSIMRNEQGTNRIGTQAIAEETFNRADVRGHSLERVARWTSEPGGYYDGRNTGRVTDPRERAILNESLDKALAGSNVSNFATDNSSGSLAQRELRGGEFTPAAIGPAFTGESFFTRNSERAAHAAWKERAMTGNPVGITQLGASPTAPTTSSPPTIAPGAVNAPSGETPSAFIMHHTGGRGDPSNVVADWRAHRPGIGTQYIMDREGNVHDVRSEYGYGGHGHIVNGSGAGAGLSNANTVGMEVVARDDKDVTPAQREAGQRFIRERYPNTPVFGHGEVNPGHREASEGMTIVDAIRRERAEQDGKPKTADK
jgi:hypothetical protein